MEYANCFDFGVKLKVSYKDLKALSEDLNRPLFERLELLTFIRRQLTVEINSLIDVINSEQRDRTCREHNKIFKLKQKISHVNDLIRNLK
jgi:hypothetical protein